MKKILAPLTADKFLPALPLILFPMVLLGRLLVQGKALFWGLPVLQFNPWRLYAWEMLRSGEMPLWNALNGMGAPLMANYQLALWYPPSWPLYLFAALGGGPALAWGHTLVLMLHLMWAGFGMARLVRALGGARLAQTLAGLAYCLSGYMLARAQVFPMVWTAAWLPWVILGASQIAIPGRAALPGRSFLPLGLAFSIAFMLLAGHAQLSWYILLFAGAWVLVGKLRGGLRKLLTGLLRFGLAGLLAAALSAIQLLPTAEYLLQSQRSAAVDYELGMTYSFWPWRFLDLLLPNAFGVPGAGDYWGYAAHWEDAIYLGLLPLLLALGTLRAWKRDSSQANRGLFRFLWLVIPLVFVLALGKNTPVFPFLYAHVPTFALFQAPTRFSILAVFALALLAGLGVADWSKPAGKRLERLKLGVVGAAAIVIGAAASIFLLENTRLTLITAFALAGVWAYSAGVLTLTMPPTDESPSRRRWNWAAAAVVGLDLIIAGWSMAPGTPISFYSGLPANVQQVKAQLGSGRLFLHPDDEYLIKFWRFFRFTDYRPLEDWDNLRGTLLPNMNLLYGIDSANNFDPFVPGRYAAWMESVTALPEDQRAPWLRLMGVSTVESRDIRAENGITFTGIDHPTSFYWATCAQVVAPGESLNAVAQRLAAGGGEMQGWVVLEDGLSSPADCRAGDARIELVEKRNNRAVYSVDVEAGGWLVISDTWYPGWKASVDGAATEIQVANQTFRAIVVMPGQHMVVLSYAPLSFQLGWMVSLLAALFSGLLTARRRLF